MASQRGLSQQGLRRDGATGEEGAMWWVGVAAITEDGRLPGVRRDGAGAAGAAARELWQPKGREG